MTEPLEIVGHLNRFGRDVTPIATDAIFRRGDTRFVLRDQREVSLSQDDLALYESDNFLEWLPMPVSSTLGRLLFHEDMNDVRRVILCQA